MSGAFWLDLVTCILLVIGAVLSLTAAIGLLRFKDVLTRLHAQAKPQSAGLMFLLIALGLQYRGWQIWPALVLVLVFQLLTTPSASIVLARAGYRSRHYEDAPLYVDELADDVKRADLAAASEARRERLAAEERERDASDAADGPQMAD